MNPRPLLGSLVVGAILVAVAAGLITGHDGSLTDATEAVGERPDPEAVTGAFPLRSGSIRPAKESIDASRPARATAIASDIRLRVLAGGAPCAEAEVIALEWTADVAARAERRIGLSRAEIARRIERHAADASGRLDLPRNGGRDVSLAVAARAPGFAPMARLVRPGDVEVEIVLDAGCELRAIVRDPLSAPLAGARVVASLDEFWTEYFEPDGDPVPRTLLPMFSSEARSDAAGNVTLSGLAKGQHVVAASAADRADYCMNPIAVPRASDAPLLIELGEAAVDGIVRDKNSGLPLADARIEIRRFFGDTERELAGIVFTDSAGRFASAGVTAEVACETRVQAMADGYATRVIALDRFRRGERRSVEIDLERADRFDGVVESEQGEPLGGLHVVALDPVHWTGLEFEKSRPDGGFSFQQIAKDRPFTISVGGDGVPLTHVPVTMPWPRPFAIRVARLEPLVGRLVADGYPLEGARIRAARDRDVVTREWVRWGDVDAATGSFTIRDVPAGACLIDVFAKGYAAKRLPKVSVEYGSRREPLEVRLERGARVTGVVREDGTLEPVCGARVKLGDYRVISGRVDGGIDLGVVTDAQGRFEIDSLQRGTRAALVVEHDDFATVVDEFEVGMVDRVERSLRLPRGGSIRVTATRPDGLPVARVEAILRGPSDEEWRIDGVDGDPVFRSLRPGLYTVRASINDSVADYRGTSRTIEGVEVKPGVEVAVAIDFSTGSTLRGRIVGETAVANGGNFGVAAWIDGTTDATCWVAPVRLSDYSYVMYGLPAGTLRVRAWSLDRAPPLIAEKVVEVAAERANELDFWFGAASLSGRVTQAGGLPASAGIYLRERIDAPNSTEPWHSSRADHEGRFVVGGLAFGTYTLEVTANGCARLEDEITFDEHRVALDRDFTLEPACSLRVFVTDRAGAPLPDARITVRSAARVDSSELFLGALDGDGARIVRDVGTGAYRIRVVRAPLFPASVVVQCVAGGEVEARVALRRPTRIALKLKDASGALQSRAPVALVDRETWTPVSDWLADELVKVTSAVPALSLASLVTDEHGVLSIEGLPEGEYEVTAAGIVARVVATTEPDADPIVLVGSP